jgi:outer membrane protein assembly factor BamB
MVSNRRSIMHSDETVVLNPRENRIVWHRDILEVRLPWTDTPWPHTRGYGGGKVAIADIDEDGADEIVLCYPAEYSVVRGKTGEQYIVENTGPLKGTDNFWVFGGMPLVADLDGDGALETLSTSSSMILAFAHREGRAEILWRTEPNDGASGFPAIGDTDGDGYPEIGLPGFKDGFRCLDAATGKALWTVPSQGSGASNCIAVDINGDGIDEFLYANGNRLLAVARRPGIEDAIIWQMDLPVPIQNIAVADIDSDDGIEILAGGNDGILYCVK